MLPGRQVASPPPPAADPGDGDSRFRSIVEASPMGMHLFRLEPDGRLVLTGANPAADRLLGIEHRRLVGRSLEEAFPGIGGTEVPDRFREVARSGATWRTEQLEFRDDRIVGAFEVHAFRSAPSEMVAMFLEITPRKVAEENLRRSEEKYRLLVENQHDFVVKVDLEGLYLFVTESFCRFVGKPEAEMLGRPSFEHLHEEDRAAARRAFREALAPPFISCFEGRTLTPDGWRWVVWSARAVRDRAGQVAAVVETGRDDTERRAMEERLRQAEKLQAIGQLAGGVAHDFNNQLTGILANADILAAELPDRPELMGMAVEIRAAAKRSARLTQQLLAFARQGKVQVAPVDVHEVIADVLVVLRRSLDKRIAIRTDLAAVPSIVFADPTLLHGALLNLALNARDAMPDGGELRFATAAVDLLPARRAALPAELPRGPLVQIQVTDTGVGMSAETRARIFEPFFTTKDGRGTGLGLAAVYGTVRSHGGAVSVESSPGRGTAFTIWLPPGSPEAARGVRGAQVAPPSPLRVMVVDDEPDVRSALARLLLRDGHEVIPAARGEEAVATYRERWRAIDLVILDMVMPDLSGREVYDRLLAVNPQVRVVVCSGYSLEGEAQAILANPRARFLPKPFALGDVRLVIAELAPPPGAGAVRQAR